jgi:hypothetical protein
MRPTIAKGFGSAPFLFSLGFLAALLMRETFRVSAFAS